MSILFREEGVSRPKLRYKSVSDWLKYIISKFGFSPGKITYIFCNDDFLIEMNSRYLGHDFYTDIVTFDYSEGKVVSGDMFVSIDRVKENSIIFNSNTVDEFLRVIVHGLLHLIGFNDSNDDERTIMRRTEDEYIFMFMKEFNGDTK